MPYPTKPGTVYLVGAGPGDPDLITVRGLRLIRQADVLVYDRLIPDELLDEAPLRTERIFAGKARGHHTLAQDEINAVLVKQAWQGKTVVRLKGGDPFVFGRGGEEALALAQAGIPFEIVPGITSAVSVPAYAGIPVTHRAVSTSFTVVTGHTCGSDSEEPDWEALARVGTLVILMGVARLPQIAEALIAHGRSPETPVAVVQSGATAQQQVRVGALGAAEELIDGVEPPATIVVGEVVSLREHIDWFTPPSATDAVPFPQASAAEGRPNAPSMRSVQLLRPIPA